MNLFLAGMFLSIAASVIEPKGIKGFRWWLFVIGVIGWHALSHTA